MIIEREESWGLLKYDTLEHRFSWVTKNGHDTTPYIREPVVLNADLTMKCNMACRHCVAKDFEQVFEQAKDLEVSKELIACINNSPFMVIVITGGEPLLPEYEDRLTRLLKEIKNKGLVIDTNGTIIPSDSVINTIVQKDVLVRVSWDSGRPQDEIHFRQAKKKKGDSSRIHFDYYYKKIETIRYFSSRGINVAVQSVLSSKNVISITEMPAKLSELGIKKWYIQRFIPSHRMAKEDNIDITAGLYEHIVANLAAKCLKMNIECVVKKDRRHNSVFLLLGEGDLYTQGEKPRQKIFVGSIKENLPRYFDYVSCSDHADRYYGGNDER
ncbi:radical SAM protein [Chloroflexota bacterium]